MKIAVTYKDGVVFQHFGHTEQFKIYDVEDGQIKSSRIVDTEGRGHEVVAGVLLDEEVDALICGGIGSGAIDILADAGVEVCPGVAGDVDEAVSIYLMGELEAGGANCSHHEEAESESNSSDADDMDGGCGCGCSGGCGSGGCGGGCGGCHEPRIMLEGPNAGKTVRVHYQGTFDSGEQFDSSYDRGEPLEFICGAGMMIAGFDKAVVDMEVGQIVNIHLMPSEAYGEADPAAIFPVEISQLPGAEELEIGQQVYLSNAFGQPLLVKVVEKNEKYITFDANHEMAGKELNFKIELVEVL